MDGDHTGAERLEEITATTGPAICEMGVEVALETVEAVG
jgi:hypothetical protein